MPTPREAYSCAPRAGAQGQSRALPRPSSWAHSTRGRAWPGHAGMRAPRRPPRPSTPRHGRIHLPDVHTPPGQPCILASRIIRCVASNRPARPAGRARASRRGSEEEDIVLNAHHNNMLCTTRRGFLAGAGALGALALVGCTATDKSPLGSAAARGPRRHRAPRAHRPIPCARSIWAP